MKEITYNGLQLVIIEEISMYDFISINNKNIELVLFNPYIQFRIYYNSEEDIYYLTRPFKNSIYLIDAANAQKIARSFGIIQEMDGQYEL